MQVSKESPSGIAAITVDDQGKDLATYSSSVCYYVCTPALYIFVTDLSKKKRSSKTAPILLQYKYQPSTKEFYARGLQLSPFL